MANRNFQMDDSVGQLTILSFRSTNITVFITEDSIIELWNRAEAWLFVVHLGSLYSTIHICLNILFANLFEV